MTKLVRSPIDAYVGGKIKLRRAVVGMSQTELANRLGITFQQVQKYEKGANRVGASRLYLIATILDVPVQSFFEGVEDVLEPGTVPTATTQEPGSERYEAFIRSPSGVELCKAFLNIEDHRIRKQIMALIRSVSEAPGEGADGVVDTDAAEAP